MTNKQWLNQLGATDFADKSASIKYYVRYMLNRTQAMFEYEGLPDTIPHREIELMLQVNGHTAITSVDGKFYALWGSEGGEVDVYYRPTRYIVANPALNLSANYKIGEDCAVIYNDSMHLGLLPMYRRYATLLAENDISIRLATINTRPIAMISAPDDRTKTAGDKYLADLEAGKAGVIAENGFLDGIRVQPYSTTAGRSTITQLIELQQYLKAGWFNDIGLQANYNMKRESINSNEAQLNDDALLPLVDNMLACRQRGLDTANKLYGLNMSVKLASSWRERGVDNVESGAGDTVQ